MLEGEKLAWEILEGKAPSEVSTRTQAYFDRRSQTFRLRFFSQEVDVVLRKRVISGNDGASALLLARLRRYANLTILRYLIHSTDTSLSRNLVNPAELSGGQIYRDGSHVLLSG